MTRYFAAAAVVILALVALVPNVFAGKMVKFPMPTQNGVKQMILDEFYPPSKPTDACKTTVEFKEIDIAQPRALSEAECIRASLPKGSITTSVKATFRVIQRTQLDPKFKPTYTINEATQVYTYFVDEFGKPRLSMISHPANRSKNIQYNDETPPSATW